MGDHLPDAFREVFVMREIEQMNQAETAERLGLKEETAKTRLHRARRLIESHLLERAGQGLRTAYPFGDSRCIRIVTTVLQRIAEGRAECERSPEVPGARDPRTAVVVSRQRDVLRGNLDRFHEAWRQREAPS